MSTDFDYIVVGCGGIGSAALYWLAKTAGNRVLGLEQFKLGHDHGGSQDHSRIIRLMYHDDRYTKLTPHTYTAFAQVEAESGLKLVHKTGSLDIALKGSPGEDVIHMFERAMDSQHIRYDRLNAEQLKKRFPQFTPGENMVALYQADGGLVDAALSNSTHIQLSLAHGAHIEQNCPVTRIETHPNGTAAVHTTRGEFTCKRVIVTAGAWINHVLGSVGVHIPLKVTQEQVTYYATPHVKQFTKERFPVFIYHGEVDYYGMPSHVNSGSKIGLDATGPVVTPETRNYTPDPTREKMAEKFLEKYIPTFLGPKMYTKTCLYAMPPDRHFIVDTLASRGKPQIIVCNGAGHAFKFSCLLGKILSEMAVDGKTQYDVSDFKLERPAINDPTFNASFVMGSRDNPPYSKL